MSQIRPFKIAISEEALEDLGRRLAMTRWPDEETPNDWSQGVPLAYMKELCHYWQNGYYWRKSEARLNRFDQFVTEIDSLDIHFIHQRSKEEGARPLLLTHGWPGSIVEFHKVIDPLTDPVAHGGKASDAFHVIAPSLPGYGFSGQPSETGWNVERIARAWAELMTRLGYDRYFAQGGDWGAGVTTQIGMDDPGHCDAIHLNMPSVGPDRDTLDDMSDAEQQFLTDGKFYQDWDSGYAKQQSTRPQTLGYGLADSPMGQAAWIIEKFYQWTDCDGHPENILSRDELLDNVMLYWLTDTGASSARLYWESFVGERRRGNIEIATGCSIFPKEITRPSERWVRRKFTNLKYYREMEKGGHFAAFEQPELFVGEMRAFFGLMRSE